MEFLFIIIVGLLIGIGIIFIGVIIGAIKNRKDKEKIKKYIIALIALTLISIVLGVVFNTLLLIGGAADKPIIYLYPTEETTLSVKLGNKDNITCSYPKYIDEWNIIAKPNGDLNDINTGRKLYSLYYESKNTVNFNIQKDGFIVEGEKVSEFLEEKLTILGLAEKESEEFIIYWLPRLQKNKYNYIRFATMGEIEKNMPLEFSVKPDTIIRVLMTYKGLNKSIKIDEQQLETPIRNGFVAVEWGGTEIK